MADYTWLENLLDKEFIGPYEVSTDCEYLPDLRKRYRYLKKVLSENGAQEEYIAIVDRYTKGIIKVIESYYKGKIITSQKILNKLIKEIENEKYAVDDINSSKAFPGSDRRYVDLFRARYSDNAKSYDAEDMLHIRFSKRELTKNERFSISGLPCLYLGNSSYCCWIELGQPNDGNFNVSPVRVRNKRVLNLAVSVCDWRYLESFRKTVGENLQTWLKLVILTIATSYRVVDQNRFFKSEYIVSQQLMLTCKEIGIDGIAYYSKRVVEERLAVSAVNVALFAEYNKGDKSKLLEDVAIEDSMNFGMYHHFSSGIRNSGYPLRIEGCTIINSIGNYKRQIDYRMTDFYEFDKYLYKIWIDADDSIFGEIQY